MDNFGKIRTPLLQLKRFIWGLATVWTIIAAASLLWHTVQTKQEEDAQSQARVAYEKDVIYRRWNAVHGGVYVSVTKETQPNPHLSDIPERDISTPSGKMLTLMNPAYMTRQAHELEKQKLGVRGHITSLNPIRPENAPDSWETEALRAFERGDAEISSVEDIEGKKYMRLMRPLITEKGCLKCHAKQGYHEGDIRGGISVSIPMEPFWAIERKHVITFALVYGLLWMAGLCGLGLGGQRLMRTERERRQAEEALQKAHEELEKKVEERTADLAKANIFLKQEISQREIVEKQTKQLQEYLQLQINRMPIGLIVWDLEFRVQSWNPAAEGIFGYRAKEAIGKHPYDLIVPKEFQSHVDVVWHGLLEGDTNANSVNDNITKDGRTITCEWSNTPIKEADGTVVGVLSMVQNITDRKQAEESLRESEEKYRDLVENINDVIYAANTEGIITYVSPVVEAQTGYRPSEVISKSFSEFIYHEDLPFVMGQFQKILSGEMAPRQYRIVKKSGETLWIQSSSRPIFKGDNIIGFRGSFVDITHFKNMEEQLRQTQKMESIGTLAGGIAHDFNNILGIILGNTELALDDVPEWNPARLNLEEVRIASLRAKDVVRQLLSFARKTKLEKKPTNIIPIIKESLKLLRSSIPTSIEIRQNIPKDIDTILADPTQIHQVLINLCTNADHAMPDGGIIEVTLKNVALDEDTAAQYPELNPGRYVNLTVADTGHGISQGDIDRIFDPYFTTKEVGRGTGMGLAVVHGIVKGHNGLITVESELGKGTTFSIFFPVVEKEAVIETKTDDKLPTGDERVLFIDDEESIAKLGRYRLERLGYKVEATTSPIEALALFCSQPDKFDLVITDLTMPKMTGDKLVKEILNIRPNLPIILCTGFSEKIDEKKAKEIGAADYIEKPLDMRGFAFKVRKVLDGK